MHELTTPLKQRSLGWRKLPSFLLCIFLIGINSLAQAALYSFVDEKGVTHFSNEQLDERYQLFSLDEEMGRPVNRAALVSSQNNQASNYQGTNRLSNEKIKKALAQAGLTKIEPTIKKFAQKHGVDPSLIRAVIAAESGFNTTALSPKGAIGLMQVIPDTGRRYGVQSDNKSTVEEKLMDPSTNIATGVRYLKDLLVMFSGRTDLALAAYNAGEGAVKKYSNQIPPYKETQSYVSTVMQLYQLYGANFTGMNGAVRPTRNFDTNVIQKNSRVKLVIRSNSS